MNKSNKRIIVTGGDGRFAKVLKKTKNKLDILYPGKKQLNILSLTSLKKYIKKYTQAGTMANYKGLDPHDDNKWEEKAEKFARKELSKWL